MSTKQVEKFHRRKKHINDIVKNQVRQRRHVLYGGHALNHHLPDFLDRPTEDFDVYSRNPRKTARMLEQRLDRMYGNDLFYIKPAKHPGTFKVMSRVTEKEVADFTVPEKKIPSVMGRDGIRYASLSYIEQGIRKTLRDKESEYRHAKDRDALRRIQVLKAMKRRKPKNDLQYARAIPKRFGF